MTSKIFRVCALIAFVMSFPVVASAAPIIECGGSSGISIDVAPGAAGSSKDFYKDGFSSSRIELDQNGSELDVIFYNGGRGYRASSDGQVVALQANPTRYVILVATGNYTDTYIFEMGERVGEVVWTEIRFGGSPKASMMRAECRRV